MIDLAITRIKRVSAIIVAAGKSERMGGEKMLMELNGEPLIMHTLRVFEASPVITEIVVVTRADLIESVSELGAEITKLSKVVVGGKTRTESVQNGLFAVSKRSGLIAVHDGARPFVTKQIIRDAVHRAEKYHAAAPAVPVKSTIKQVKSSVVIKTPERAELFEVQTPQVFDADLIKGAIAAAIGSGKQYTDDCAAVEAIGAAVHITKGAYGNIKLTTPDDLILAEAILNTVQSEKPEGEDSA